MAESTPKLACKSYDVRTVTGWTIFFMVLLRISIGWHLFYEGIYKLHEPDWRATAYLVTSAGPFRPVFRAMVTDPDGTEHMTKESIHERIDDRYNELVRHYGLDPAKVEAAFTAASAKPADAEPQQDEQAKAEETYANRPFYTRRFHAQADEIIADPQYQRELAYYKYHLEKLAPLEKQIHNINPTPEYDVERLTYDYGKKAWAKNSLLNKIEKPLKDMEAQFVGTVARAMADEKLAAAPAAESSDVNEATDEVDLEIEMLAKGPAPHEASATRFVDFANMWGLTLAGACLMLGLFTRFSAVCGAGMLLMYYLAMPSLPGLPENPMAEGHYLVVNKNLIEFFALMMIATSRIGRWCGLDALVHYMFCRPKPPEAPSEAAAVTD